jgi:HSP20 family molecular chaperone IbpA
MPSYPHSDVWVGDEGKELWMRFALAGYASENVNVKAAGKTVRVIANSKEEPDVKFVHHGISNKNVDFTLNIDEGFDPQKAKVTFKEGMLTIVIPRSKGNEIIDLM